MYFCVFTVSFINLTHSTLCIMMEEYARNYVVEQIKHNVNERFPQNPPSILDDKAVFPENVQTNTDIENLDNFPSSFNSTNATDSHWPCNYDVTTIGNYVYLYGVLGLLILAVFFNGLQFVIFNTSSLRRYAFSVFLVALSLVDFISLFR